MTLIELIDSHRELVIAMKGMDGYILEISNIYSKSKNDFDGIMTQLLRNGLNQEIINLANNIRSQIINDCTSFAKSHNLLKSHQKLFSTKAQLDKLAENSTHTYIAKLAKQSQGIIDNIEISIQEIYKFGLNNDNGQLVTMLNSLEIASINYRTYLGEFEKIEQVSKSLEKEFKEEECIEKRALTLHFYNSESDLSEYIQHYKSIITIYEEFCDITQISDVPLKIIRIESGSFFEKLFGAEKIIDVMSDVLKRCIELIFKKYTQEGKIIRRKELMDSLSQQIDLVKKCEESGITVKDPTKERIEKTLAVIAGEALSLASKSAKIKIDNIEYSTAAGNQTKYLEHSRQLLIEGNQEISTDSDAT